MGKARYSEKVLVKCLLHNGFEDAGALIATGIELMTPTAAQEAEALRKREAEALEKGIDPFATNRETGGWKRPDGGKPVFGKQGLKNAAGDEIVGDVVEAGYVITNVHVLNKPANPETGEEADPRYFLVMVLVPEGVSPKVEIADAQRSAIREHLRRAYRACHVWDNGDNATINFAGRRDRDGGTQLVRMRHNGQFFGE